MLLELLETGGFEHQHLFKHFVYLDAMPDSVFVYVEQKLVLLSAQALHTVAALDLLVLKSHHALPVIRVPAVESNALV